MKLLLLSLFAVIITGPAIGQDRKIVEIIVKGNKFVNKESIVFASGLKVGEPLTTDSKQEALRRVAQMGFFGARQLDPSQGVSITERSGSVVIDVDENDRVREITISGNGPVAESAIRQLLNTKSGQVLNLPLLSRDLAAIKQHYEQLGYQAYISEELSIGEGVLSIPIAVGRIGSITFKGLDKVKLSVLQRRLKSKVGEYYNFNTLRRDLTQLLNTKLFENVEPAFTFPKVGRVDIIWNLSEKKSKQAQPARESNDPFP